MKARSGYDIVMSVDPNVSDDVCTFCRHARRVELSGVDCALGHTGYFRSISNVGPIFVSDCGAGEPRS
jgi:hypothetical protein